MTEITTPEIARPVVAIPDFAMIEAAALRLAGHARLTPLLNAPLLDRIAGRRVFVKAECLQWTGSFKFRGAWSALTALPPEALKRGILAYSSGNHAQGVAYAAALLGAPAVIIMPADAPSVKIANTRAYGAEVVLYDRLTEDREALGQALSQSRGQTLVRPYDDPFVIAGQGTIGLEIATQAAAAGITKADVLICCGGGGLTSGIALALEARAPAFRVRPVEPAGFDDTARSLASGTVQRCHRDTRAGQDHFPRPATPVRPRPCGQRRGSPARHGPRLRPPAHRDRAGRSRRPRRRAVSHRPSRHRDLHRFRR
jgi:threonine dehydratase